MADPASYRPPPGSIPESPGVYRFRDPHGQVIYVGKAKSLRPRLTSYFNGVGTLHPRTYTMVHTAASVEWVVVNTEVEALQLEYTWIKEFDPRFNVKYRDDKSYPFLAVTLNEEYPRLQVYRGAKRKGVRYFGPYSHAWAIRETLDLLLRVFPARTCSAGVFKRSRQIGRPCLLGYIDKCSAPCVERVTADEHRRIVEEFCDFMSGRTKPYIRGLERQMKEASDDQEYERAARLRDDVGALNRALERQTVVLPEGTDCDVLGIAQDELEAAVQVFYVRGGRVRGQRGFVVDKVEAVTTGDLVEQFVTRSYGDGDVPRELLVPELPEDVDAVEQWLTGLRGGPVGVRVPQRGDKRTLMETVSRNAGQTLALHKTRRAGDLTARSQALQEIQDALDLPDAPLRIECIDVSNLQGSEVVASMVVFEDGLARKGEYRRFIIKAVDGQNDVAAVREVVGRRFRRLLEERRRTGDLEPVDGPDSDSDDHSRESADTPANGTPVSEPAGPELIDPETGRPRKFAYPPNLFVVDGGAPQVAAAQAVLEELGVDDVALCGLAKRLEEVWLPGQEDPLILPRTSEGLYLLQRVRDEAHRFAVTFHRQRRSKSMTRSVLETVPGLGEGRRKALLRHFGSLKKLKEASVDDIVAVPGIGRHTAETVVSALESGETPS